MNGFPARLFALLITCTLWQPHAASAQDTSPSDPAIQQATTAYTKGHYQVALEAVAAGLSSEPRNSHFLHLRAACRVELGRRRENSSLVRDGITDARSAIQESDGRRPELYLPYLAGMTTLAELESTRQHAVVARNTADQILSLRPRSEIASDILYHRARAQLVLREARKAELDLEEAIRLNERHLTARLTLASALEQSGQPERARETYAAAAVRFADRAIVFNNRGLFLKRQNERELALSDFSQAIRISPKSVSALTNRGSTLLELNDAEAAELDLTAALDIDPGLVIALRLRGASRLLQRRTAEAVSDLERAQQLQPSPEGRIDFALALFMDGNHQAAADELTTIQASDPGLRRIRPWRFAALAAAGQVKQARTEYAADLARVRSGSSDCVWTDWQVAAAAGKVSDEALSKAAGHDPGRRAEAEFFSGFHHSLNGDITAARRCYSGAIATGRSDLSAYRAALIASGAISKDTVEQPETSEAGVTP